MAGSNQIKARQYNARFWRPLILATVIFLAVSAMRSLMRDPYASALAFFVVCSVFYWVPPRPNVTFGKWMLRLLTLTVFIFLAIEAYVLVRHDVQSLIGY